MSKLTLVHSKEAKFTAKKSNKINLNNVKEIAHSDSLLESLRNVGVRNIKVKTFTEVSSIGLTGESKTVYYFKDDELFHFIDDGKVFDAKSEKDIERQIKARFRKGLWGDKENFYRLKINDDYLMHHGVLGQEWGKRHGPPYPLDSHISTGKALRGTSETKFGGKDIEPSISKPKRPINRDAKRCNAVPNNNNNCTYCCMAYELHRRGLGKYKATKDVTMGLSTKEIYEAYSTKFNEKDISYPSDSIFEDKNANVRELTFRDHSYKVYDADDLGNFLSNKYKEDARGVLLCPWASARAYGVESGHCISWELTNGKLTLIDPQENSVIKNPNRFLEAVECYDLVELRTDDKVISDAYLKKGGVR